MYIYICLSIYVFGAQGQAGKPKSWPGCILKSLRLSMVLDLLLGRPLGYLIFSLMAVISDPIYQYFSMGLGANLVLLRITRVHHIMATLERNSCPGPRSVSPLRV